MGVPAVNAVFSEFRRALSFMNTDADVEGKNNLSHMYLNNPVVVFIG